MSTSRARWLPSALLSLLAATPAAFAQTSQPADGDPGEVSSTQTSRSDVREIRLDDRRTVVRIFQDGRAFVSRDRGANWRRMQDVREQIALRFGTFDPLQGEPVVPEAMQASETSRLHIVQFETQIIQEYRNAVEAVGGEISYPLPHQAFLVRMNNQAASELAGKPGVRWVGKYHPAYKLDGQVIEALATDAPGARPYNVMFFDRDGDRRMVAQYLEETEATIRNPQGEGIRMVIDAQPGTAMALARLDQVLWIDPHSEPETDIDLAREQGGANFLETVSGINGKGVTGIVAEGTDPRHPEFEAIPPYRTRAIAIGNAAYDGHGQSTAGEIYSLGVVPEFRGLLPFAQMLYANTSTYNTTDRLTITKGGIDNHRAMLETASWGYARTTEYTADSAEMDDLIFQLDFLMTQSQSNAGNQDSRPQAWAKNIVSVGGFRHQNTLDWNDDVWGGGGSTGPAADGRLKPDLSSYYDQIGTVGGRVGYTTTFGGTSGATPIVNGYAGLTIQMFAQGEFGYPTSPSWSEENPPVAGWQQLFEFAPHFTTAKALMINTARQHDFSGPTHDMTRVHQGWGMPNVQTLYENRDRMLVVDETVVLEELESKTWTVFVQAGTPELRATMTHVDREALPTAMIHRVNSLDLSVMSPSGTVYWGNNGLSENMFSTSGGLPNDLDTVENVWVQNPEAGEWTVTVRAAVLRADAHLETATVDTDFALVVSGISGMRDRVNSPALDLESVKAGGDDFSVTLTNLPAEDWTHGYTFFVNPDGGIASTGSWHGIEPGPLSELISGMPAQPGSVFHFVNEPGNYYPFAEHKFSEQMADYLSGVTFDAVVVFLNDQDEVVAVSNVDRVRVR